MKSIIMLTANNIKKGYVKMNNGDIFFEANPNPMWVYEPKTLEIKAVNEAAVNFYGYSRHEMLSMTIEDLRPESEIPKLKKEVRKSVEGHNNSGVWLHQKKDGTPVYLQILSYPIQWKDANCKLVVGQDVSKQKKIEQSFLEEQELLDVLAQNLPGTFYIFNRKGKMRRWNRHLNDASGYSDKEIEKMSPLNFFNNDEHAKVNKAVEKAFSEGFTEVQAHLAPKQGEKIPYFFQASRITIDDEPHLIGVGTDISNLKKAEKKTEKAEKKLQELYKKEKKERLRIERINSRLKLLQKVGTLFAEQYSDHHSVLDKAATLLVEEVADICSFDIFEGDSLKRVVQKIILPEKKKIAQQIRKKYPDFFYNLDLLKEIIESGKPLLKNEFSGQELKEIVENDEQFKLLRKLEIRAYFILPLKVQDKVLGTMTLIILQEEREFAKEDFQFLTELANRTALHIENSLINEKLQDFNRELDRQVQERTRQLENTNDELESFSYSVSHDLRTPLRAIAGYTSLLLEDYVEKLDKDGRSFLSIINNETHRMGDLIDDLLAFSRLSRTEKVGQNFSMEALVKECINEIKQSNVGVKLEIEVKNLPEVNGDPDLLRQVWMNLIGNSVKYREKDKSPHILVDSYQQKNHIVFYVQDDGVGFNMKYADKLFGVFQRLHSDDEFEGTGIGLALARRIISRHGGEIWAESELNNGSTFYFSIPKYKL